MERFYNELLARIALKQDSIKQNMANGHIQSMEQYRQQVGQLLGLADAAYLAEEALKKLREL